MTKQLLIYENVAPLNIERHRDWSVKGDTGYGFARNVNSVPLTAVEMAKAATVFPIVFAGQGDDVMPIAIMGVRKDENLFLDDDGKFTADYVPAFFRRYPFVFSTTEGGDKLILCIDESFDGFNQEGRGERLFDADGEQTQYLKGVLAFLQEYQAHFGVTKAFSKKLKELELLEPVGAQFKLADGQPQTLTGFMVIQRNKLHQLKGEQLEEMSRTGMLELAYIHLQSLNNFGSMMRRVTGEAPSAETADEQA